MATWAGAGFGGTFIWLVVSWLATQQAQDRLFFRHYRQRVGPLPKPYDETRLLRSVFERGLSPGYARRYIALRTPIDDPWLDRRRRTATFVQWLWTSDSSSGWW